MSSTPSLESKLYGCWLGKSIGGTLGLPVEGRMERLSLTYYDPVPKIAPPNDDLELQLVWLKIIEDGGSTLTPQDFANAWLRHIHYMWDEYGRCRWNLRRGVPLRENGTFENWFGASMGSPIRSEIWACLFPQDPASAAYYAAMDSTLDHGTEGIAGEVFCALVQCHAATGADLVEAMETALRHIPEETELARAVRLVLDAWRRSVPAWSCWELLLQHHNPENFTHAPLNVALVAWALAYGNGDFEESLLLCVNGGYDTDSTGATVGAALGLHLGADAIPERWRKPIGDGVYLGPGILDLGTAPRTLQELTQRQGALIGKLEAKTWDDLPWHEKPAPVDLAALPGTIYLRPHGSTKDVAWANGELPAEVKQAGGATWSWDKANDESRALILLAREGAQITLDGRPLLVCPAGLPYVPATHRCPAAARTKLEVANGLHEVRLNLNSHRADQDATVLLAYPNLHLAPWTAAEFPHFAKLDAIAT